MTEEVRREASLPNEKGERNPWLHRGKTALRVVIPWLVPVLSVFLLREAHRVGEPPALTNEQLFQLATIARQELTDSAGQAAVSSDLAVTEPVFVTVYGTDPASRTQPALGRWHPTRDERSVPIEQATRRAARDAAARLRELGRSTAGITIKVDIAGPSRRSWVRLPLLHRFLINPGRDGWHGWRGDAHGYRLPSWRVERGEDADAAIAALKSELGGSPTVGRFRTTSLVLLPDEPTPRRMYRANVLVNEVTTEQVTESLRSAGRYLARSVREDGSYCYEYLPREDRCSTDYNLLRHAGTTYSLFQIHRRFPDPAFRSAAERATDWMRQRTRSVANDPSRVYLLEGKKAKLGAAGLALIALVEREHAIGDGKDRELMTQLANFIISQQREDGYFASFFDWGPGADVPPTNSIYYPGEALLGLIRLHRLTPQPRLLASARLGTEFLVKRRWRWGGIEVQVPPDAWLTQALAELDAIEPEPWLRDYAYEIVLATDRSMLREEEGAPLDFVGGPSGGLAVPQVTPAGSRSEGLTAAWRMAQHRGQQDRAEWLADASLRAALFQLNHQHRRENDYYLPNPARVAGGFWETPLDPKVRIDTVQHNATGLLGVLHILSGRPM